MSDLREKLAERLWLSQTPADLKHHSSNSWADMAWREKPTHDLYLRMADECIRQMEWAFNAGASARCPHDCKGCRECADMDAPNLTPAPDDWTPTPTKE